jgi:hypothetical protein
LRLLAKSPAFDLILTKFRKITLVGTISPLVSRRRRLRLTCQAKIRVETEEGPLFTVSSALFKLKPLLRAYELLIVHGRGALGGDENHEHWWMYYEQGSRRSCIRGRF